MSSIADLIARIWLATRPVVERALISAAQAGVPTWVVLGDKAGAVAAAFAAAVTVISNALPSWRTTDARTRLVKTALQAGVSVLAAAGAVVPDVTLVRSAGTAALLAVVAGLSTLVVPPVEE